MPFLSVLQQSLPMAFHLQTTEVQVFPTITLASTLLLNIPVTQLFIPLKKVCLCELTLCRGGLYLSEQNVFSACEESGARNS